MKQEANSHNREGNLESVRRADVADLLDQLAEGNSQAFDRLFDLLYDELREMAHRRRQAWRGDYTLNTTALVHEAYLKLAAQQRPSWENRAHFMAAASKAIRHILVNYARDRSRLKRGGGQAILSLDQISPISGEPEEMTPEHAESLLLLETALKRLEQVSQRNSRIVECRFFGELTIEETASALGISTASVSRGWKYAQLWLYQEMAHELTV